MFDHELEVSAMRKWLADTQQIVLEQQLEDDADLQNKLAKIEIELDGVAFNLPNQKPDVRQLVLATHKASITDGILDVLKSAIGYYALPDQPRGQNEPVIGPELAHHLKHQLIAQAEDVYWLKHQLVELLAQADDPAKPTNP